MPEEKKKACPFRLAGYHKMVLKCSTKVNPRRDEDYNELPESTLQSTECLGDRCEGWNEFTKTCCFRQLWRLDDLSNIARTLKEWKDKMVG